MRLVQNPFSAVASMPIATHRRPTRGGQRATTGGQQTAALPDPLVSWLFKPQLVRLSGESRTLVRIGFRCETIAGAAVRWMRMRAACVAIDVCGQAAPAQVQSCFPRRSTCAVQFSDAVRITDEGEIQREELPVPTANNAAILYPMIALLPEPGICCWDFRGVPVDGAYEARELDLLVHLATGARLRVQTTLSCAVTHASGDDELVEFTGEATLRP